jgi:hypothetical protein
MNNFIYKNIKVFQGGSPGLVQQKKQNYTKSKTYNGSILIHIKNICKSEFNFDLVAIQAGYFFEFVEEDADLTQKHFGWKNSGINFSKTGTPTHNIKLLLRDLSNLDLSFCVLEQISKTENFIQRKITHSTNTEAIDWTIKTPTKVSMKLKNEITYQGKTRSIDIDYSENTSGVDFSHLIGESVSHEIFGFGKVIDTINDRLVVDFSENGIKKVLMSYLNIEDEK